MVVIEVDRLPRVQQHRSRRARVRRTASNRAMESPRGRREAVGRMDGHDVGRGVGLTRFEHDFARMQQLTALHVAATVGQPIGQQGGVAAPRDVHTVHLARPLAEPGAPGEQQRRMFVRCASPTVFRHDGAELPRRAYRVELPSPATLEPQQFDRRLRQRQRHRQRVERVATVGDVGERCSDAQHVVDHDRGGQRQAGHVVERLDDESILGQPVRHRSRTEAPTHARRRGDHRSRGGQRNRRRATPRC